MFAFLGDSSVALFKIGPNIRLDPFSLTKFLS